MAGMPSQGPCTLLSVSSTKVTCTSGQEHMYLMSASRAHAWAQASAWLPLEANVKPCLTASWLSCRICGALRMSVLDIHQLL